MVRPAELGVVIQADGHIALVLADLEALHRRRDRISKDAKGGDKHAIGEDHMEPFLEPWCFRSPTIQSHLLTSYR